MKYLILVLLVSIIVFSQCDSNLPIVGKEEKSEMKKFIEGLPRMCYFARLSGSTQGYKIIDNNDGTISLVSFSNIGSEFCPPPFGKTESTSVVYYIKKCVQGQVYRQAQNDCKGTGTAANYYNAQKYQGCPTNDTACDDSVGNQSKTLSPARASCILDTTKGLSWDNEYSFSVGDKYKLKEYLLTRKDELPITDTDFYWLYNFGSTNMNRTGGSPAGPSNKNLLNYVLCFKKQENE